MRDCISPDEFSGLSEPVEYLCVKPYLIPYSCFGGHSPKLASPFSLTPSIFLTGSPPPLTC